MTRHSGSVVLNVDDSDERLRYRTMVLEDAGFGVLEARTGTQALAIASDAQPSLILLDVLLPDVDGLEVCRRLKADPITHAIPVLHVSAAFHDEEHWLEGLRVGSDGYLRDPVGPDVLSEVVRTVLRRVEAEAAAQRAAQYADEALRASERRYRGVVEHAPFGICQATDDGRFVAVNDALAHMLGYGSASELAGSSILPFYANPAEREMWKGRFQHDRTIGPFEAVWKRRDHQTILVRVSGRRIDDGFEAFIEDITEKQRLEEQLRQAAKLEAIGRLAGGVAHDFNNALTIILGVADMLTTQIGVDKPIGRDLAEIRRAAQHAAALTHQLLAFARQQPLHLSVIDLNGLVGDAARMLERLLGETIHVETITSAHACTVTADKAQLQQVLVNLAVNARDAMREGGVLTIETARAAGQVRLTVRDTGAGMDDATKRQIFEPFFTTKEMGRGTGLGLATVYGIVQQLGGSIVVDSAIDQGTRFDLYFPEAEGLPEPPPANRAMDVADVPATILVVEDEPGVRAHAAITLSRHGYTVVEMSGPKDALLIDDQVLASVDLMLTDVVMPFMSGPALAKRLQQRRPSLAVLYMSGYPGNGAVSDAAMLRKPFSAPDLLSAVRHCLSEASHVRPE